MSKPEHEYNILYMYTVWWRLVYSTVPSFQDSIGTFKEDFGNIQPDDAYILRTLKEDFGQQEDTTTWAVYTHLLNLIFRPWDI